MALNELIIAKEYRLLTSFTYEAVTRPKNGAGWAPGGSILLVRSDVQYTLILKEITNAYELVMIKIGQITLLDCTKESTPTYQS